MRASDSGGMDELAAVTDDVEVYVARIKGRLNDSSDAVRADAVDDIGIQTTAPELAVPLLVAALNDSSDLVPVDSRIKDTEGF